MIIIGERINSSIKSVRCAIENQAEKLIEQIILNQVQNQADYIDVNCGTFVNDEKEKMKWLIELVKKTTNTPIAIDSPSSDVIEYGIKVFENTDIIINSITAQKERWNSIHPIVTNYNTSVIALCMDDNGIPDSTEERVKIALSMVNDFSKSGVGPERVFLDPMIQPVSTDSESAKITFEAVRKIREELPDVHITCGLSNVSFGLPARKLINRTYLSALIFAGLDSAIIDPMDKELRKIIYSAEALVGKDEYCMNYIAKYREGFLES